MANTAVRAIAPYATSPASTPITNLSASHASHATCAILSGTACTDACTTNASCTSHGVLSSAPSVKNGFSNPTKQELS